MFMLLFFSDNVYKLKIWLLTLFDSDCKIQNTAFLYTGVSVYVND